MVAIRKAKQAASFRLRRKGRGRLAFDTDTVGLIAAGFCIGIFLVFLYSVVFSESSTGEPRRGIAESLRLRKIKNHPVLMETMEDGDGDAKSGNENNKDIEDTDHPPIKHVRPMNDGMNAIALDIVETLDCVTLLKDAEKDLKSNNEFNERGDFLMDDFEPVDPQRRRRLQQHADDGGFADAGDADGGGIPQEQQNKDGNGNGDDDSIPGERWGDQVDAKSKNNDGLKQDRADDRLRDYDYREHNLSAKHLFCMAASENPPEAVAKELSCDHSRKKRTLLELWSAARSQMSSDLLLSVLDIAMENTEIILGNSYYIWAPKDDEGLMYMVNSLNSDADVDNGGLNGLEESLGPGKIFVDVGSCLGLTCLVINSKYPGTKIVSIEPASPNWLLQELNLRCNMPRKEFQKISIILEGVGANTDEEDNKMAKLMWRPTSTTATRSWTPASEFQNSDKELIVRLRKLKSILAEAEVLRPAHIDVLNVDCQGCEYDMIPGMKKEEFEEIPIVMGSVHWGYIELNKLPSSERGRTTHERICSHENIARKTKECCAFPDLPVRSNIPGEVLQKNDSKHFPPHESTVSDVIADELCDDFPTWAREHYLNEIPDDFNWFELSSQA